MILKFPTGSLKIRIDLMRKFNVGLILDVGANTGQYAANVRCAGYTGDIVSFEPLNEAFNLLSHKTDRDHKWSAVQIGLGDFDGESVINVSKNLVSSSILNIRKEHTDAAPESKYIAQEKIVIQKLDSIFSNYKKNGVNTFLKIDTQGFEKEVITGAIKSLGEIVGIQVEMSLVELYEGELMFDEMKKMIESHGFELYYLEPGFSNPMTGKLMQVDGIFFRN
jgi:FkbM family methyltransferase